MQAKTESQAKRSAAYSELEFQYIYSQVRKEVTLNVLADQNEVVVKAANISDGSFSYIKTLNGTTVTIDSSRGQRGFYIRQPIRNYSLLENLNETAERMVKESSGTNVTKVVQSITHKVF